MFGTGHKADELMRPKCATFFWRTRCVNQHSALSRKQVVPTGRFRQSKKTGKFWPNGTIKPSRWLIPSQEEKLQLSKTTLNSVASFVASGESNTTYHAMRAIAHCHSADKNTFVQNKNILQNKKFDPYVIRTRNLLIWSQTRYRCAKESCMMSLHVLSMSKTSINCIQLV